MKLSNKDIDILTNYAGLNVIKHYITHNSLHTDASPGERYTEDTIYVAGEEIRGANLTLLSLRSYF